jgi:hypothetical protein
MTSTMAEGASPGENTGMTVASDDGTVAVLAHLCLNALAVLEAGLTTWADSALVLTAHDRHMLMADVLGGIRQVEALSRALVGGNTPRDAHATRSAARAG